MWEADSAGCPVEGRMKQSLEIVVGELREAMSKVSGGSRDFRKSTALVSFAEAFSRAAEFLRR